MKLSRILVSLLLISLVAGATTLEVQKGNWDQAQRKAETHDVQGGSTGLYVTDFGDEKKLIGFSDNVFVGRVLDQISYRMVGAAPELQYSVDVVMNIKGNLDEDVVVYIGPDRNNSLEVGATYIMATRYNEENNFYAMGAAPYDRYLITDDARMVEGQLRQLVDANENVQFFEWAYINEIPYSGPIVLRPSYNTYATRCLDATGELIDDTVQLAREKQGLPKAECVTRLMPEETTSIPVPAVAAPTQAPTPTPTPKRPPPPPSVPQF